MFRAHFASTSFSKVVVCLTLVAGVTFGVSAADVMAMDSATEAQIRNLFGEKRKKRYNCISNHF